MFRIGQREPVSRGIRRIVREEIDSAIRRLRVVTPKQRDESIHEARKSIKKVRGIVRMLMPALGQDGKADNATLRDTGRLLSEFRDAAAMVDTIDVLIERFPGHTAATALAAVRKDLKGKRKTGQDAAMRTALQHLTDFRKHVALWQLGQDDFSIIEPGFLQTYRAGRKSLARAQKHPDAEHFHELRKRAKDHWYQVRLLEGLWTEPMKLREKSLKDLQDFLGDDHNLAVLHDRIAGKKGDAPVDVKHLIEQRQKELREDALALGAQIYEEKPKRHMQALGQLWAAWRGVS